MIVRRLGRWPAWSPRSPFEELERMRRELDRLFEDTTRGFLREPAAGVFPMVNVTEDSENYYVRAELPGIKPDELDISVTGNSISISGVRKISAQTEDVKYHRREREAGEFSRIISLPGQVEPSNVEAQCNYGVLTMILPKPEAAKPKQIEVRAS